MAEPESQVSIPLETGKIYLARIEDSGGSVEGLVNLNGYLVFVPGARPGQDVKIRITKILGRVAFGEIEE